MADTDQLKTFLSRVLPWADPDEPQTYIGVHWATSNMKRDGKPFWNSRAVRSVDEAVRTIHWIEKLEDARDIYIAMGSQKECVEKTSKAGHAFREAIRNHNNVAALKSLFLDIDVKGEDKGYASLKEAGAALAAFVKAIDLPRPTLLVGSGGGIHAHWELDTPLPLSEWQPLANALAEATRQHNLKCDTQVTVDAVRVLRPPLTKNWKTDPPKSTGLLGSQVEGSYAVERIRRALEPYARHVPTPPSNTLGPASSKLAGIQNDAAANIQSDKLVNLDGIATECPFISEALDTGGADFGQPLWNLTTLIATFAEGEREDAHRMAMGHPDYTEETTDALYDRKLREREEKSLGWPSCGAVLNAGCTSCRTCPKLGEGKSPLNFTPKPAPPAPATPTFVLPKGYFLNKAGIVCKKVEGDEGSSLLLPIIDYPLSDAWLQKDPWIVHFSAVLHDNVSSKIEIPYVALTSNDTLLQSLAKSGIPVDPRTTKEIREFFVSWVKVLQARKNAVTESAPYGWNTHQGAVDGFCYGGEVWTPNGSRPAPNADRVLHRQYQPTGSTTAWFDAVKLVTQRGRPELEVIIASAFAAPLIKATGWHGSFMSAYSQESGIGKTTAMKIAQAVWGDPTTAMQSLDDTLNSVSHKIGMIRSLPLYWDEIKGDDSVKKFMKLAFSLTGGKDKSRLGRDAALREVGKWQTMLISATNESLIDYVTVGAGSTTAGIYRLFEFEVRKSSTMNTVETGDAQRLLGKLEDNFGGVGYEYAKWLGANYDQVDADVGEMMKRLEKAWDFKQDERFWLCTIVCTIVGAGYCNDLGFAKIDIPAMEDFLYKTLQNMRLQVKDTHVDLTNADNLVNILTQFFKAMNRHTLWTNRLPAVRGRPRVGEFRIVRDATKLDGIHVHIGKEDKLIRISSTRLSIWLQKEAGISRNIFTKELARQFHVEQPRARLGSGTDYAQSAEHLLEIHAAGTPLSVFIDETEENHHERDPIAKTG